MGQSAIIEGGVKLHFWKMLRTKLIETCGDRKDSASSDPLSLSCRPWVEGGDK